eukprot:TRINITY_DN1984_c0_g1_i1.p1 TRINITY_DN1984_c0_g1~~TRINITY_DN1984_c0_g1_i1.p1  ORF type:complete len:354 (+),score=60.06 TRINITY_DN1984_c0_g1_i1:113-1174(+)
MAATPTDQSSSPAQPVTRTAQTSLELNVRAHWMEDESVPSCLRCSKEFSLFTRRHHCRACGRIFCGQCSNRFILLPGQFQFADPERVCTDCYRKYSNLDMSRNFDEYGSQDAPTVIFLHGNLANRKEFHYQIQYFASKYHVVAVDFPGCGSRKGERLTPEGATTTVYNAIKAHSRSGTAILFGASMGAYVAMTFARQHPEMVEALVLSNCTSEQHGALLSFSIDAVALTYGSVPESLEWEILPKTYPEIPQDDLNEPYLRSEVNYKIYRFCAAVCVEPKEDHYVECLRTYQGPVLLINGEKAERKTETKLVNAGQNAQLHVIKGGTAMCFVDPRTRVEFNEVSNDFIASVFAR